MAPVPSLKRFFIRWIFLIPAGLCLLFSACASKAPLPDFQPEPPRSIEDELRSAAIFWEGVPHCSQNNATECMDCSQLVRRIYQDLFHILLPRTTADQVRYGHPVADTGLAPGDLVFFKIPDQYFIKRNHVGIYLGKTEFLHASYRNGVTISSLNNPYWRIHYWTARRNKIF